MSSQKGKQVYPDQTVPLEQFDQGIHCLWVCSVCSSLVHIFMDNGMKPKPVF